MPKTSSLAFLLNLVCAACGGAGESSGGGADTPRPNVLLISLDSSRRDLFSCYGRVSPHADGAQTSPAIDRLAAEGALFLDAYSTSSWTLPAHMGLMTGQPDMVHAVEVEEQSLSSKHELLAERLSTLGYRTAGFYSGPYLGERFGFHRGFDTYKACYGPELAAAMVEERRLNQVLVAGGEPQILEQLKRDLARQRHAIELSSRNDSSSLGITDAVLAELGRARADERPFFVFAHYFDPHYDYRAPQEYVRRFDPDYRGSFDASNFVANEDVARFVPTLNNPFAYERVIGDRDFEHVWALYDAELAWTDYQVGRIVEELRTQRELDDTLVIIVADHGDEFFEHGTLGHRKNLHQETVHIPLIIRYPRSFAAGTRVQGTASLADVYATVLDVLDDKPKAGLNSASLVPLARGEGVPERYAISRLIVRQPVTTAEISGLFTGVRESYVQGFIKIRRERRWIWPARSLPEERRAQLEDFARAQQGREFFLGWTDLRRPTGDRAASYSGDFSDPRAKAALQRFRSIYRGLAVQRARPGEAASDDVQASLTRGFGYGGDEGSAEIVASDTFFDHITLPVPGARK